LQTGRLLWNCRTTSTAPTYATSALKQVGFLMPHHNYPCQSPSIDIVWRSLMLTVDRLYVIIIIETFIVNLFNEMWWCKNPWGRGPQRSHLCRHLVEFSVYFNSVQQHYPIRELRNLWQLGHFIPDFVKASADKAVMWITWLISCHNWCNVGIHLRLWPNLHFHFVSMCTSTECSLTMDYIFVLWFLLSFYLFFLALSQHSHIGCLPYFHTWCGLSPNLGCRCEMCCTRLAENTGCKKSPKSHARKLPKIRHLCTKGESANPASFTSKNDP